MQDHFKFPSLDAPELREKIRLLKETGQAQIMDIVRPCPVPIADVRDVLAERNISVPEGATHIVLDRVYSLIFRQGTTPGVHWLGLIEKIRPNETLALCGAVENWNQEIRTRHDPENIHWPQQVLSDDIERMGVATFMRNVLAIIDPEPEYETIPHYNFLLMLIKRGYYPIGFVDLTQIKSQAEVFTMASTTSLNKAVFEYIVAKLIQFNRGETEPNETRFESFVRLRKDPQRAAALWERIQHSTEPTRTDFPAPSKSTDMMRLELYLTSPLPPE